jgi:hypothetical protein
MARLVATMAAALPAARVSLTPVLELLPIFTVLVLVYLLVGWFAGQAADREGHAAR